ncbi:MAG TPA: hypothetical protein VES39_11835 [Rhodospirillales bacterium]|nr:hypothetical protein [Rhodospirillales bacterium]
MHVYCTVAATGIVKRVLEGADDWLFSPYQLGARSDEERDIAVAALLAACGHVGLARHSPFRVNEQPFLI